MQLFDKIFESINTGIINALNIDDKNSSINYMHNAVSNDIQPYEIFLKYINEKEYIKAYELYNMYDGTMHPYKVQNFETLMEILIAMHKFFKIIYLDDKNFNINNYRWVDTADIATLILKNGQEISLFDVEPGDKPVFLKLKGDYISSKMGDNGEIIISTIAKPTVTGTPYLPDDFNDALYNYQDSMSSGWKNTKYILDNLTDDDWMVLMQKDVKSIYAIINEITPVLIDGNVYKPYIPSFGEMGILQSLEGLVRWVVVYIMKRKEQPKLAKGYWCSSSLIKSTMTHKRQYEIYKQTKWHAEYYSSPGKILPFYKID